MVVLKKVARLVGRDQPISLAIVVLVYVIVLDPQGCPSNQTLKLDPQIRPSRLPLKKVAPQQV